MANIPICEVECGGWVALAPAQVQAVSVVDTKEIVEAELGAKLKEMIS